MELDELDLSSYRDIPENCTLMFEIEGAPTDALQSGGQAAIEVFRRANVHPYAAWLASQTLAVEWHDVVEAPGELVNGLMDSYYPLCVWADAWSDAEQVALTQALSGRPNGRYVYRFTVGCNGQDLGDEGWVTHVKGQSAIKAPRYLDYYSGVLDQNLAAS